MGHRPFKTSWQLSAAVPEKSTSSSMADKRSWSTAFLAGGNARMGNGCNIWSSSTAWQLYPGETSHFSIWVLCVWYAVKIYIYFYLFIYSWMLKQTYSSHLPENGCIRAASRQLDAMATLLDDLWCMAWWQHIRKNQGNQIVKLGINRHLLEPCGANMR